MEGFRLIVWKVEESSLGLGFEGRKMGNLG